MADIRAFRGFRYDLGQVGSLSDVVCPPYDVIDPALQHHLYESSPFNAIRVELTQDQPDDDAVDNKYSRAAQTLNDWVNSDVLRQDTARSLYVYEQEYIAEGKTHIRRGLLARLKLEPFGTGKVFPHEHTMSGPKADRLKLFQATGFNISPLFGLYPDQGEVNAVLEPLIRNAPPIVAKDHLGVLNRLWCLSDQQVIAKLIGLLGPKPVYIADGHHRYETGLQYLADQKAAGVVPDDEAPANFCLMQLVSMSDPGLLILPTHRLISGLPNLTIDQLAELLQDHFDIQRSSEWAYREGPTVLEDCWNNIIYDGSQRTLGFGTVADGDYLVAKLKADSIPEELAPAQSADWRGLAVSILHQLVIEKLMAEKYTTKPTCKYVHLLNEVRQATEEKFCQVTALIPPVSMEHVEVISQNGEKMPAKSTYFYPKLLTGMVFNSLKKD